MYLSLYCIIHLLGCVNNNKKRFRKIDSGAENGACIEDGRESGTEAKALLCATRSAVKRHRYTLKSLSGHYLLGLFRVVS